MKRLFYYILNKLWIFSCYIDYKIFIKSIKNLKHIQGKKLLNIISKNCDTKFGIKYNFTKIKNIEDYRKYVPLSEYEDYIVYIDRIKKGEKKILTHDEIKMFELTSGSQSSSKYIPYNNDLKQEFLKGINPWMYSLYKNNRKMFFGKSYWSITPLQEKNKKTDGGIPVGFEQDSEYLGNFTKFILNILFAVPSEVKNITDISSFRYVTLLFLLKEKNLSFISIWNPSYLILLLKSFEKCKDLLIMDIESGKISHKFNIDHSTKLILEKKLNRNKKRALELRELMKNKNINNLFDEIWPNLEVISCWTESNARIFMKDINEIFKNVKIQGKGLLSTECFATLPFNNEKGSIISANSHFFEFQEIDSNNQPTTKLLLAHELKLEKRYSIIVTTGGGFYRYKLKDIVKVVGIEDNCPSFEFVGRENSVSDICGEKLNEYYVSQAISNLIKSYKIKQSFCMVAPEIEEISSTEKKVYYVMFLEVIEKVEKKVLINFINEFEKFLCENFHYDYCRKLNQLGNIKLFLIDKKNAVNGLEIFYKSLREQGMKEGNIKPSVLSSKTGWVRKFSGRFIEL